jgi:enoyl-CoA hydratase
MNAINRAMPGEIRAAVAEANADPTVRVIMLRGAGRSFCAGYDLDWGTRLSEEAWEASGGAWDPVEDYRMMGENVRCYMALWESPKPVVAGIHGWCVGGGTDLVLCADQIVAAEDARLGYPPSRVWGTPTTAMWVYRVGIERAKCLLLTGDAIDGKSAAAIGLVGRAVPADKVDEETDALARRMANLPVNQLVMLKLLVTRPSRTWACDPGSWAPLFDGAARHRPGIAWQKLAWRSASGRRSGAASALRRLRGGAEEAVTAP